MDIFFYSVMSNSGTTCLFVHSHQDCLFILSCVNALWVRPLCMVPLCWNTWDSQIMWNEHKLTDKEMTLLSYRRCAQCMTQVSWTLTWCLTHSFMCHYYYRLTSCSCKAIEIHRITLYRHQNTDSVSVSTFYLSPPASAFSLFLFRLVLF